MNWRSTAQYVEESRFFDSPASIAADHQLAVLPAAHEQEVWSEWIGQ